MSITNGVEKKLNLKKNRKKGKKKHFFFFFSA